MDFSGLYGKADVLQCFYTGEGFRNIFKFYQSLAHSFLQGGILIITAVWIYGPFTF